MKFTGTLDYVATTDMTVAVNAAIALSLGRPVIEWHVKSTTKAAQGRDLAPADPRAEATDALPRPHGALLKNEQDVHLFERLAFLARGRRS